MTTWDDATIGLARGWPCTEMPYSTSVPMTRRTLMRRAYASGLQAVASGRWAGGPTRRAAPRRPGAVDRGRDGAAGAACAGLRGRVLEIGFGSGLNIELYPPAVDLASTRSSPSDLGWALSAARRAGATGPIDARRPRRSAAGRRRTRRTTPCCRRSPCARSPTPAPRPRGGTPGAAAGRHLPLPRARPGPRRRRWRGGSAGSSRCSGGLPAAATSAVTSRPWCGRARVGPRASYLPGPGARRPVGLRVRGPGRLVSDHSDAGDRGGRGAGARPRR